MVKEFVNPNLHVVLIHLPLGLMFAGVFIELFSFLGWRHSSFRTAGRWMILLGTFFAVPAALSGAFALYDVALNGLDPVTAHGTWKEITASSPLVQAHGGEAWEHMVRHAWLQSMAVAVLLFVVLIWLSCSDRLRHSLHVPLMILVLGATGLTASGAWYAGEGIYTHGVAVMQGGEASKGLPATAPTTSAATEAPASAGQAAHHKPLLEDIEFYIPSMEAHVIGAGFLVSMVVVALGLGIRGATTVGRPVDSMDDLAAALGPIAGNDPSISPEHSEALRKAGRDAHHHTPPSARFWMLAVLLGLITASIGAWMLAGPRGVDSRDVHVLWAQIRDPDQNPEGPLHLTRRLGHVIGGGSIIVLSLLLAIFGRFAPRRKFIIVMLGLLLLAVAAAQIWLGILLMFDTNSGPIKAFN